MMVMMPLRGGKMTLLILMNFALCAIPEATKTDEMCNFYAQGSPNGSTCGQGNTVARKLC